MAIDSATRKFLDFTKIDNDDELLNKQNTELKRSLSFIDGLSVIVSIMIGSGIFASPGVCLQRAGSPGAALLSWCIAGVLVMVGACCYAELGAMLPSAGGDYEYLTKTYGKRVAFTFGWYYFWISKPGSQAIIATVFGNYLLSIFSGLGLSDDELYYYSKIASISLVVILGCINCAGVRVTTHVNNTFTIIKLCVVAVLFVSGISYAFIHPSTVQSNLSFASSFQGTHSNGIGTAVIACLWAFEGWADINFLSEELHDASQLPKIISCGVIVAMVCYITSNIAYLSVLDGDAMKVSSSAATDFGDVIGGNIFSLFFAVGVAIATTGSANGSIMTGGRVFFAIGRSGEGPVALGQLNEHGSPYVALAAQCVWSVILLLLPGSSFSSLLNYFGPASWLFYALTASCVVMLRYREPEAKRPFKVPFYPLPPILLGVLSFYLIINSLVEDPLYCMLALIFVAISVPLKWCIDYYVNYTQSARYSHVRSHTDDDLNDCSELTL